MKVLPGTVPGRRVQRPFGSRWRRLLILLSATALAGLSATAMAGLSAPALADAARAADAPVLPWSPTPSPAAAYARTEAIAALGAKLFFDPTLSASGRMACSTCHDPAHGFAAPNALSVQPGGPDLRRLGVRAVPTLTYGAFIPTFSEHYFEPEDEGNDSTDQGPTGGRTWDGRVDRARDQAVIPLLAPNEMANPSPEAVVASVLSGSNADEVRALFGADVFADPARAFAALTEALEYYQETQPTFSPFTSKYDASLSGHAKLTAQEASGLALFNDPEKGNCAQCHKSAVASDGRGPLFTDFGFIALGVPRNKAIPANADPAYYDLGLCGPQRHDLTQKTEYCGLFKTPTLRNVGLRQSFYHNGAFHTLRDAVAFYAQRDSDPAKWYPTAADGTVQKFDDIPAIYRSNVSMELPFGPHRVLSDADVDDLVAFLRTLTDGYQP
jgi:cytochrome c peroxidase